MAFAIVYRHDYGDFRGCQNALKPPNLIFSFFAWQMQEMTRNLAVPDSTSARLTPTFAHYYEPAAPSCTLIFQTRSLPETHPKAKSCPTENEPEGSVLCGLCCPHALKKKPAPDLTARQARDFDPRFHNLEERIWPATWIHRLRFPGMLCLPGDRATSTATINLRDPKDALLVHFSFIVVD
jgi:hypothetical protein